MWLGTTCIGSRYACFVGLIFLLNCLPKCDYPDSDPVFALLLISICKEPVSLPFSPFALKTDKSPLSFGLPDFSRVQFHKKCAVLIIDYRLTAKCTFCKIVFFVYSNVLKFGAPIKH